MARTVLHVIPYMAPRAGGPVVVADRLSHELTTAGYRVRVATTDAYADHDALATSSTRNDRAYDLHTYATFKLPLADRYAYSSRLADALPRLAADCDLIHVHTLWTHPTYLAVRTAQRMGKPYVVMPHGMLDPHSLARKALKKKLYGRFFEFPRLRGASAMLYTTNEEQRLAESAVRGLRQGFIVPLGSGNPPGESREEMARAFFEEFPRLAGRKLVVHLGRIHPKKGLDLLIPAFARATQTMADVHLLLIGPDEDGYLSRVLRLAERHGIGHRLTHIPFLSGTAKWNALAAASVFALPSYQENFGIAVVEAARCGTPLLVSNRVNLWSGVKACAAGLVVECRVDSVTSALKTMLADPQRCAEMGRAGMHWARTEYTWSRCGQAVRQAYDHVLSHHQAHPLLAPKPDLVATACVR